MSKGKIILGVIVLMVITACITFGVIYSQITTDNIQDKYTLKEQDDGITLTVLKGSILGDEYEISENQLNTFIDKKLCRKSDGSNSGIDHIMIYFHEDEPAEIYAHAFHKGFEFAFRCKADFSLDSSDNTVRMKLYDAYAGEFGLSDSILNDVLRRVLKDNEKVRYINESEGNVEFTARYTIEIPNTNGINIRVEELSAADGALKCRTNNLTGEALRAGIEYVSSEEGRESISGFIDEAKNKLKEKIGGLFS